MKNKKIKNLEKKELPPAMREFENAFQEFFNKKPKPKNDEEERKEQEEFYHWYNYIRKQSDTGKTPAEMYKEIYGEEPKNIFDEKKPSRFMNFEWDENYKEPDEMFYEADQLFLNGKYKEALALTDKILEILPDEEEALLLKAEILPAINKKKEAEEILEIVSKKYGKSSSWHFHRASLYFWHGNLSKALESIKEAMKKDQEDFDVLLSYAQYLYLTKDELYKKYLDKARKIDYKRVKNFEKKYWISQKEFVKGSFIPLAIENIIELLEENMKKEAKENIEIILKYSEELPKDILIMLLGLETEGYIVEEDYDTANKKIEFMLMKDSDNPHSYFYKSQILFKQDKLQDALDNINLCLEKSEKMIIPHPDFFLLKSMILKKLDDDEYLYYENKAKQLIEGLKDFQKKFKEED
jgi:hypothetical protein